MVTIEFIPIIKYTAMNKWRYYIHFPYQLLDNTLDYVSIC